MLRLIISLATMSVILHMRSTALRRINHWYWSLKMEGKLIKNWSKIQSPFHYYQGINQKHVHSNLSPTYAVSKRYKTKIWIWRSNVKLHLASYHGSSINPQFWAKMGSTGLRLSLRLIRIMIMLLLSWLVMIPILRLLARILICLLIAPILRLRIVVLCTICLVMSKRDTIILLLRMKEQGNAPMLS